MKKLFMGLLALALSACGAVAIDGQVLTPTLAPNTATFTPTLPTPTHQPSSATPATTIFQPTVTPQPFTPFPPAAALGQHIVLAGETIFCLGRGYGVLPAAIAQANNLAMPYTLAAGHVLTIPAIQWLNISPGPVCPTQFVSPYPGLPAPSGTPPGSLLSLSSEVQCTLNCSASAGAYTLHLTATALGGMPPYTFLPEQIFAMTVQHCVDGAGSITVSSADGQAAILPWYYHDIACMPTARP